MGKIDLRGDKVAWEVEKPLRNMPTLGRDGPVLFNEALDDTGGEGGKYIDRLGMNTC